MYTNKDLRGLIKRLIIPAVFILAAMNTPLVSSGFVLAQESVIRHITQSTERLELTVNSSRILTLEKSIPRMVVNNPELVSVTALSKNQIQIAARNTGVTQINLWDEDDNVYSVDIAIYGDVRELQHALKRLFPKSSVKVLRLTNSLVLEGFVEKPEAVSPIIRLAEDYAPKIVNNITVGGVQQVLLKVKIMEVSRTKLRSVGFDFAQFSGGNFITSSVSGILNAVSTNGGAAIAGNSTINFGIVDGNNAFFGFLDALQQNNLAKILADPTIVAVSGRPAHFNVGGELPYLVPAGLGVTSIEFKPYGTQVDFVPIVLGNGNIRLEVRPRVSEIDDTRGVNLGDTRVPGFNVREVDTAVEMKAGQTLALAGLIQTRVEAQHRGIPYLSDLPYLGAAFRKVEEKVNEIELLILVTPEFVDGMDPHEVPPCGPGLESVSPGHCQLYFNGHLEVPSCGPCGPQGQGYGGPGCSSCEQRPDGVSAMATDEIVPIPVVPMQTDSTQEMDLPPQNQQEDKGGIPNLPADQSSASNIPAPVTSFPIAPPAPQQRLQPLLPAADGSLPPDSNSVGNLRNSRYQESPINPNHANRPQYQEAYRNLPQNTTHTPGLIGPIGYDVE
jgi:pilus assembly protein CpaC